MIAMDMETIRRVTTTEEARDVAIAWQHWFDDQTMTWGELAAWQLELEAMAERFDLVSELRENGVI